MEFGSNRAAGICLYLFGLIALGKQQHRCTPLICIFLSMQQTKPLSEMNFYAPVPATVLSCLRFAAVLVWFTFTDRPTAAVVCRLTRPSAVCSGGDSSQTFPVCRWLYRPTWCSDGLQTDPVWRWFVERPTDSHDTPPHVQ